MTRFARAVAVVAVVTLGVGCGDDEERLSREEFTQQANAICERHHNELDAAFEERFGPGDELPDADQAEKFVDDVTVPNIEGQIEELRELHPPEDVEDDFEELLDDVQDKLEEVEEMSGEEVLAGAADAFAEVNTRATQMGLTVCGAEGGEGDTG